MFFDKLFGADKPAPPQTENVALLTTTYSPEERAVIESILRDAEMPYLARERGTGEVVRIVMGTNSTFGCDFYVEKENLEDALALIAYEEIEEEPYEGSEEL